MGKQNAMVKLNLIHFLTKNQYKFIDKDIPSRFPQPSEI